MKGKPWTEAEIIVMREHYQRSGFIAPLRLLTRSKDAIKLKAQQLGLVADRRGPRDRGKGKARKRT